PAPPGVLASLCSPPALHSFPIRRSSDLRLAAVSAPGLLQELSRPEKTVLPPEGSSQLSEHLEFGAAVGEVLAAVSASRLGDINIDRKSTRLNSSHVKTSYAVCGLETKSS